MEPIHSSFEYEAWPYNKELPTPSDSPYFSNHGISPFSHLFHGIDGFLGSMFTRNSELCIPRIDIFEHDSAVVIQAEVPGVKNEDLKLEAKNGMLFLSGERKPKISNSPINYLLTERCMGKFVRGISIPHNVIPETTSSKLADGVLEITIPKGSEKSQYIHIE